MMAAITVTSLGEDRFTINVRGHELLVDQPHRDETELGPSPTELFVTSLAACVGHYATRFLRRRELAYTGLRVSCEWTMLAAQPARVGRIRLQVVPPAVVPPQLQKSMQEAIEQCTVHNSLRRPPEITITVAEDVGAGTPAGEAT